jgi:hypothetical protein
MAVMNTAPAGHPTGSAGRTARHIPTTRLCDAGREASCIDAMGDAIRDGGWPMDVLSAEENT